MKNKLHRISIILFLFSSMIAKPNNLQIGNVQLASINKSESYIMVKFDISWENSWRSSSEIPYNWDAAWVFVKYRINNGEWLHAKLSNNAEQHVPPAESTIQPGRLGLGVFLYQSSDGKCTNNWQNAQIRWNYTENFDSNSETKIEVKVIGIEMVYVAQGAFYAGDNGFSKSGFQQGSADIDPWYIGTEHEIHVRNATGGDETDNTDYYYVSGGWNREDTTGSEFIIPADFPKGYNAFYSMKYEISQGQYTDFLNLLTRTQQSTRVESDISSDAITNIYVMSNTLAPMFRNNILCSSINNGTTEPIVFSCSTPEIASNYLSWEDGCAYADWAGLRPMTELEFEKACRGKDRSKSGEFAWGNTTIANSEYTLSYEGTANESISSNFSFTEGNVLYNKTNNFIDGPVRVGIFAATISNYQRITSGAGYWGIMELSGNIREHTVTVGSPIGRSFIGNHGNGSIDNNGNSDVLGWPNYFCSGFRGGGAGASAVYLYTSDRYYGACNRYERTEGRGFRCVRCP